MSMQQHYYKLKYKETSERILQMIGSTNVKILAEELGL